ncbi:MAG: hypothetical protein GY865_03735 [candidate division Zixibacteria bacterium]|nr:hypothetical protein [candidate division Zixibacteria bacterium]
MKQICTNCHFLGKQHSHQAHDEGVAFYLDEEERQSIKNDKKNFISESYSCRCLMSVWDQRFNDSDAPLLDIINKKERKNKCFFFPYNEGTSFEAAKELQKRSQEHEQLNKSNKYTRIGLWVASGALLINAIVGVIKLLKCA